jgi:2-methylisocitrate lyase-like PEP mutase family enzyme
LSVPATFRALLDGPGLVVAPGAWDAIGARLIEQAGFPLVYMTGAGTAVSRGFPDYGLLTLTEMAANAAVLADAVSVPVLADADTGYGNELNVTRTVREYEARGVAGIHLEDQVSPKRCGHLDGKEVVERDRFVSKIAAAVAARSSDDFVIVARTDAAATRGLDDAIDRANAALDAGADVAFVEAPPTPVLDLGDAEAMGYKLAIVPTLLLTTVLAAGDAVLRDLAGRRVVPAGTGTISDVFARFGAADWDAIRGAG